MLCFVCMYQIYAESKNLYPFSFINSYMPQQVQKNRKRECTIDFDINQQLNIENIKRHQRQWNKHNTGTYVYVYNNFLLLFIENDKVKKSLILSYDKNDIFSIKLVKNATQTKQYLMKKLRFNNLFHRLDNYILNKRFIDAKNDNWHTQCYCNRYVLHLEYDKKYGFITSFMETKPKKCIYERNTIHDFPSKRFSYGLLMLPKETEYTDKVVKKILNKYKQAWECEKKLLASKKTNNEQNLTMLEKAVGKEKLECLNKYLVWDENESQ